MNYYAVSPFNLSEMLERLLAEMTVEVGGGSWSVLIDTAFDQGGHPLQWSSERSPVYFQGRLAPLKEVSPVLYRLEHANTAVLRQQLLRLLRHCQGRPMLSFVLADMEAAQLCLSWQSVLEVETEDSQMFVLRFADTRTLPTIEKVLRKGAWEILSGNVRRWLFINREGALQELDVISADRAVEAGKALSNRISDPALTEILRSGQVDALASALNEYFPELLFGKEGGQVHVRLAEIDAFAAQHEIDAFPDVAALAVADFSSGGALINSEGFAQWFERRPWVSKGMTEALTEYLDLTPLEGIKCA